MNNKALPSPAKPDITPQQQIEQELKGLTLNEIRYQRALILLKREFCAEKIRTDLEKIRARGVMGVGKPGNKLTRVGSFASKAMSGFNYIDYALMGFSLFSTLKKIRSFFRKKK